MASQNPNQRNSLYPQVIDSNPDAPSPLLIPIPHPLLKSHSFPTSFKTSFPRMPQLLAPPPRRLRPPRRSSSASPVRSSTSSIRTTASSLRAVIFPSSASGRETTPSPCTRASPKRSNGLWQRMRPP